MFVDGKLDQSRGKDGTCIEKDIQFKFCWQMITPDKHIFFR